MTASTELEPVTPAGAEAPRRRRFDLKLGIASLAIAIGVILIGWGLLTSQTGDDVTKLPEAIESVTPVPDAVQIPSQTNIVVDLQPGYTGRLAIDGVPYSPYVPVSRSDTPADPGTQVDIPAGLVYDPGNATLTFTAGEDVGFDEFELGNHTVTVVFWKLVDALAGEEPQNPELTSSYTWTFNIV